MTKCTDVIVSISSKITMDDGIVKDNENSDLSRDNSDGVAVKQVSLSNKDLSVVIWDDARKIYTHYSGLHYHPQKIMYFTCISRGVNDYKSLF